MILISGCTATGPDLAGVAADRSLTTSSVHTQPQVPEDRDHLSDEMTVRNAVSSADPSEFSDGALAWSNSDTGSRGVVSAVQETKENDHPCRAFSTTLESYAGVSLYRGEICLGENGLWTVRDFGAV